MFTKRVARGILLVTILCFPLLGTCSPAFACSCLKRTDAQKFDAASDVFIGRPIEADPGNDTVWTFQVEERQKGDVAGNVEVHVASYLMKDCGFNFELGKRYQVFAYTDQGQLRTSNCSGTREVGVTPVYSKKSGEKSDPPVTPKPTATPTRSPSPSDSTTPVALPSPDEQVGDKAGTSRLPIAIAAILLVGAAVLVGRRFRRA